ncbi:tetratricopeptide repeat protein [bacterium]|nr:tetratricopeptide repeat protein [bacterium]
MLKRPNLRDRILAQAGTLKFALLATLLLSACTERRQGQMLEEADTKIGDSSYTEAAEILKRAVALHPESRTATKALYKLGFVEETYLKDFEGALSNYRRFVGQATDPMAAYEVQKRIAALYFEQTGDPDQAVTAYRKLLSMSPESLEGDLFQFRIGQGFFRSNEFEKAREAYQELLAHYPKSHLAARARFEIGNTYYMEGRYDIGLEALKQVVRNHPQSEYAVEAQFLSAECLEHLDQFPAALQTYESIVARYSPREIVELRIREVSKRMKKAK